MEEAGRETWPEFGPAEDPGRPGLGRKAIGLTTTFPWNITVSQISISDYYISDIRYQISDIKTINAGNQRNLNHLLVICLDDDKSGW